jgi:hypothetical protein
MASRQIAALRGRRAQVVRVALSELLDQGCTAAGYRLAGTGLDHICCRHLYAEDRLLTVWPGDHHAIVVAVGPHDRGGADVYDLLLTALGLEEAAVERSKPSCCDETGRPPVKADAAATAEAVTQLAKRTRSDRRR